LISHTAGLHMVRIDRPYDCSGHSLRV
jgi:hypothetical protein